ncbi:hypothetical protein HMPREF9136_1922 [Prevotella dentalis DSM 3688]|uniref:Uncharacterized protein n=1 Tax=Prevotella dentalis (strain ATCC 49559 / DSM 3688 / JCM 13448 / NCTC 12043 / ES 2772) TaxID=908937 RepID=F9D4Z4_PREDD|nr:hypothetical protein HMPREF9136_1922 [Prevotella dentalis DSM 3688]
MHISVKYVESVRLSSLRNRMMAQDVSQIPQISQRLHHECAWG